MTFEWDGNTKLSRQDSLLITWMLWDWLSQTGSPKKNTWPFWQFNGGKIAKMIYNCPCCHYAGFKALLIEKCKDCPLLLLWGPKCKNGITPCNQEESIFNKWMQSENIDERRNYAQIIAITAQQMIEPK